MIIMAQPMGFIILPSINLKLGFRNIRLNFIASVNQDMQELKKA
jgi:hypothetical protein